MLSHIQNEAAGLCRRLGLSENLSLLERGWEAEAGDLSPWARVVALERSSLVVEVNSSAAMQEIALRRRELVRRLNRHLPEGFVRNITVRMSPHG